MSQPVVYFRGRLLNESEVALPINDGGFVLGTTVTEQLRTFAGSVFRLDQHLDRLFHSLEIIGVDPGLNREEYAQVILNVAAHNHPLLERNADLAVATFVTPGPYRTMAQGAAPGPVVCVHSYPLPFALWANSYSNGESLAVPAVRQVAISAWPRELKCRSRMHYYLADRQARDIDPHARALLLDGDGFVTEATTASMVIYRSGEGLIMPPPERVLPGISAAAMIDLARELDIPTSNRDLSIDDVASADEVLLASTTCCLLPVVRLNNHPIGTGKPGPVFAKLISAWSEHVGIDIIAQAQQFPVHVG